MILKPFVLSQGLVKITGLEMYKMQPMFNSRITQFITHKSEKVKVLVTQLCPTLCKPMDCSLPGSSVRRVLQARILEWIIIPSSGDLPRHESNLDLLHRRQIVYHLSHREDNQPAS